MSTERAAFRTNSREFADAKPGIDLATRKDVRRGELLTALVVALAATALGCSADADGEEPPALVDDGEEAELRALEIGDDEPIVDEGDPEPMRATAEENPLLEDEEDVPAPDLGGLAPLVANRQISSSERRASVNGKTYKCRPAVRDCVCQGSPLNCEMPNDQPGRNRYLPPAFANELERRTTEEERALDAGRWQVTDGTVLYDGAGLQRGPIASKCFTWDDATGPELKELPGTCVKVNFGQMKSMKGDGDASARPYVYAFNVFINGVLDSSGWVPLANVAQSRELARMGSHAPRRVGSLVATKYVIKSARDWGQNQATFSSARLPGWSLSKVAPGPGSRKVGDYLLRDGNLINLAYGTPRVGGAATDTFYVEHETVQFKRARSTKQRPTLVRVPVADRNRPTLIFAYGSIKGRFGWVALPAFKKGSVRSGGGSSAATNGLLSFCAGKPDGVHCDPSQPDRGYLCKAGATTTVMCTAGMKCVGATASNPNVIQCTE